MLTPNCMMRGVPAAGRDAAEGAAAKFRFGTSQLKLLSQVEHLHAQLQVLGRSRSTRASTARDRTFQNPGPSMLLRSVAAERSGRRLRERCSIQVRSSASSRLYASSGDLVDALVRLAVERVVRSPLRMLSVVPDAHVERCPPAASWMRAAPPRHCQMRRQVSDRAVGEVRPVRVATAAVRSGSAGSVKPIPNCAIWRHLQTHRSESNA